MSTACASSGCCEVQGPASSCESTQGRCPCGTAGCSGDPIECATGMWTGSFFQALKHAQVELLKTKIQKAWGTNMDKAADVVLEAMGVQWQSMLAQAKAKTQVEERLRSLWHEGQQ